MRHSFDTVLLTAVPFLSVFLDGSDTYHLAGLRRDCHLTSNKTWDNLGPVPLAEG